MASFVRTHTNGELTASSVGKMVTLSGWVARRRDHGGLIFIDLRDRFGVTQLLFNPSVAVTAHEIANTLRQEFVITISGKVCARDPSLFNPKLKTGEIEIEVQQIEILSKALTPPFSISEPQEVNEELRLKYRYLDIRRGPIIERLITRHKMMQVARNVLTDFGFIEVTTPILGKSTPEGARDYLVPSRIYPGAFYALPQSPQLFKQLLMMGGLDRYFQIALCFRDEDLRADRQPEFTQIDLEMSFATYEELFPLIENLIKELFKETKGIKLTPPFSRMSYKDAVEKYGTDKPDLRFEMPLVRLTEIIDRSNFSILKEEILAGNIVKGLSIKNGADFSRKTLDSYNGIVSHFGIDSLSWIKITENGISSPVEKFFDEAQMKELIEKLEGKTNDLLLFLCGPEKLVNQALDHLRRKIAKEQNLIDPDHYAFTWVTDFPLFQWDEKQRTYICEHHPFTSPHLEDLPFLDSDPLKARSSSYDLVLNGYEIASGSQRIHNPELQSKIFSLLKLKKEEIESLFGFFIEALKFGTPPHIGIALGFDRLMMILTQTENIRDVIAFPKTQKASDLMLEAPAKVLKEQLTELKIHVEH